MEMPKASFDTWVRDTHLLAYQDGRFTIGVRNSYARDWLESRLSSTATHLLCGIMNRAVEVTWTVDDGTPEEDGQTDDGPASGDELEVEAHYDLAYDEIVQPEHVTLVPRYFLRHLHLIGPELGWMYLGFRQAAFNAGARSGKKSERFSGRAIAALSGIAERTFWNRIAKAETWEKLGGLVTTSQATPEWNLESAAPRRLPRRYLVAMTLPLTAADARSLRNWLTANLERCGGPERVIEAAIATPLDELLPVQGVAQMGDEPQTVTAILRGLFAETLPTERLAALATRLHKHIMPDNDRLAVTHFFVEHILPYLGTGPGWMLTLLRDRCYVNKETGEVRDQVRIAGGYAEIAGWMGVTPETIKRWLHGKHSESRGQSKATGKGERTGGRKATEAGKLSFPVLAIYLQETTPGKVTERDTSPRTFDVLLDEVPGEILEAALDEQAGPAFDLAFDDQANVSALEEGSPRAVCRIGLARFVVSPNPILARFVVSQDPVSARFAVSESPISARFADHQRAVCSIVSARFADHQRAVCRVFKSLNHLKPITNYLTTPNQPIPTNLVEIVNGGDAPNPVGRVSASGLPDKPLPPEKKDWDWDDLARSLPLNLTTVKKLRADLPPSLLVAQVLQSATLKGVEDPVGFAITQIAKGVQAGADFVQLAQHPAGLLREIRAAAAHSYRTPDEIDELSLAYCRALGKDPGRAMQIWRLLTGQETLAEQGVLFSRVRI